eukprot:TRINITY_DN2371_c0_g3_i2.p1 TRINITY_DN2371_c0_g3~~TRINITY_DN2371_c0_g3_i2.p1  ORF type:complete len:465 (-),score=164.20 TRINITY_DN2371_c0_g3_i2:95-1429(-)
MMSGNFSAVPIFGEGASEERGERARMSSFVGALAVVDLIKTTLGPKGMDKILTSMSHPDEVSVTNDGATILKSLYLNNPAAKVLVDISKAQDDEVGDGTTSVCVLAGELLREAELLLAKKIHPQTIIQGWKLAREVAIQALLASAIDIPPGSDKAREYLIRIAKTTLSSKILKHENDHFANIAVDAVLRLGSSGNLEHIHVIKKLGGTLRDSYLDDGFLLEKKFGVNQPKRLENAKIMISNTAMDTDKIKIFGSKVRVDSTQKLAEIEEAERKRMFQKCQKIIDHGINCFINRQLIYNLPEQYFGERGVLSIEHADFDGIERLAAVTGAEITSTFDHPDKVRLGSCKLIEEVFIGEDKLIKFSGLPQSAACTIILRGANNSLLDEAERSLHDALCVLVQAVKEHKAVYGAGCSEMIMAKAVEELAAKTPGKKAYALDGFARTLR